MNNIFAVDLLLHVNYLGCLLSAIIYLIFFFSSAFFFCFFFSKSADFLVRLNIAEIFLLVQLYSN